MRAELAAKASGDAEAAFEAERARVGEARRAELEAQLAAAAEAAAVEAQVGLWLGAVCVCTGSCVCCNTTVTCLRARSTCPRVCCHYALLQANGEEPPEPSEPQVDIEQQVEAAMAAVKAPCSSSVTDADVLSALIEQDVVSKAAIVQALAMHLAEADAAGAAGLTDSDV